MEHIWKSWKRVQRNHAAQVMGGFWGDLSDVGIEKFLNNDHILWKFSEMGCLIFVPEVVLDLMESIIAKD